jgi:L-threonylcarbamoyladenylate synthase
MPTLLRPGGISRKDLETIAGPVASAQEAPAGPHASPGMHPRHYRPRTPLLLVKDGILPDQGQGVYLQRQHLPSRESVQTIQMPAAAPEYAAALYEALHQADAGNYNWIAVDLPPSTPEWEAVYDRLRRAASNS